MKMENKKSKIRLMIVDDNPTIISAIKDLMEDEDEILIVAEALNGIEAVKLSKSHLPDVILMDVKMPDMDGIESTRIIKKDNPGIKIIALTSFGNMEIKKSMIEAKADSFLDKSEMTADRLLDNIKTVTKKNELKETYY
jgi:DNA-binding NarL/FixJ family response regulator